MDRAYSQAGPGLPLDCMINHLTGKKASNVRFDAGAAMSSGIRVVKLNATDAFRDTNYAVCPFLRVDSDTACPDEKLKVNIVSASEFHIVSSSAQSSSIAGFIAFGSEA